MIYVLWKRIEYNSKGCVEDGSNTTTKKVSFFMVSKKQANNFAEKMADDYGYQDYNYQVNYDKIAEFDIEDIKNVSNLFNKIINENDRINNGGVLNE